MRGRFSQESLVVNERLLENRFKNIDNRLERIEQYLPTLATRAELHAAIQEATTPLATREELHAAIQEAIAPLATRAELDAAIAPLATRAELEAQGQELRRHMSVLHEDLRDDVRIVIEHLVVLSARVDELARR